MILVKIFTNLGEIFLRNSVFSFIRIPKVQKVSFIRSHITQVYKNTVSI